MPNGKVYAPPNTQGTKYSYKLKSKVFFINPLNTIRI